MKFQPKRFVVEVRRGTSRAAFASPDPTAEKFSDAEATLFGRAARVEPERREPATAKAGPSGGRILRSLVEPPPPAAPELPEPPRRGRKPGSKNRPKPEQTSTIEGGGAAPERPRRGRKPGSKNRPKFLPSIEGALQGSPQPSMDTAALMRSYGFAEDGAAPAIAPPVAAAEPAPSPAPRAADDGGPTRPRLRDRSTILRRYVLAIEPGPGQPGSLRAKRLARAGR